jgi:hypothetical protein
MCRERTSTFDIGPTSSDLTILAEVEPDRAVRATLDKQREQITALRKTLEKWMAKHGLYCPCLLCCECRTLLAEALP